MSSYNASGAPAKKRSPIVWIILGLIVLFVLPAVVCVGCCGGAAYLGMNQILNAPPYVTALERVKGNADITAKLGTPIETEGMPTMMNFNDAGGNADYRFKVKGPNGSADVVFNAVKENGTWRYTTFDVSFADGSSVSLLEAADGASGESTNDVASQPPSDDGSLTAPAEDETSVTEEEMIEEDSTEETDSSEATDDSGSEETESLDDSSEESTEATDEESAEDEESTETP